MQKIKVNYPKKREKLDIKKMVFGVPEPERKTLYDHLSELMKLAKRKTFLHRVIYFGKHSKEFLDTIDEMMEDTVKSVEDPRGENLTGLLLIYPKYYIHVLEGTEDTIQLQIKAFLKYIEQEEEPGVDKFLVQVSHIHQRILSEWTTYQATPPRLMGTLNPDCPYSDTGRQIYFMIRKLYNIINHFSGEDDSSSIQTETTVNEPSYKFSPGTSEERAFGKKSISSMKSSSAAVYKDPFRTNLPEIEVLDFLLGLPYVRSLQSYSEVHANVPQKELYDDRVWPIPCTFTPYDVFEKPYDMVTDLPKPDIKAKSKSKSVVRHQIEEIEEQLKQVEDIDVVETDNLAEEQQS